MLLALVLAACGASTADVAYEVSTPLLSASHAESVQVADVLWVPDRDDDLGSDDDLLYCEVFSSGPKRIEAATRLLDRGRLTYGLVELRPSNVIIGGGEPVTFDEGTSDLSRLREPLTRTLEATYEHRYQCGEKKPKDVLLAVDPAVPTQTLNALLQQLGLAEIGNIFLLVHGAEALDKPSNPNGRQIISLARWKAGQPADLLVRVGKKIEARALSPEGLSGKVGAGLLLKFPPSVHWSEVISVAASAYQAGAPGLTWLGSSKGSPSPAGPAGTIAPLALTPGASVAAMQLALPDMGAMTNPLITWDEANQQATNPLEAILGSGKGSSAGLGEIRKFGSGFGRAGSTTSPMKVVGWIIDGALSETQLASSLKRREQSLTYCYRRELAKAPSLKGTMVVDFRVDESGSVSSARLKKGLRSEAVESCVMSQLQKTNFPTSGTNGTDVTVTLAFGEE